MPFRGRLSKLVWATATGNKWAKKHNKKKEENQMAKKPVTRTDVNKQLQEQSEQTDGLVEEALEAISDMLTEHMKGGFIYSMTIKTFKNADLITKVIMMTILSLMALTLVTADYGLFGFVTIIGAYIFMLENSSQTVSMYRRITNIQMDVTMILRLKEVTKRILEKEKQPKKTAKKTTKKTKTTTPKKK